MIDSSAHADAFHVVQLGVLQQLCTKQCDSQITLIGLLFLVSKKTL